MGQILIVEGSKGDIINSIKIAKSQICHRKIYAFRIWICQARQWELGQTMKALENNALELGFPSVDNARL